MRNFLLLFLALYASSLYAQDPHLSQYFSSPLSVNPALTGNIDGAFRATANYRQQWWNVGTPFNTGTFSYEQRLFINSLGESSKLGIGTMLMYDESLAGGLKSTYGALSVAYHQKIDQNGYSTLGAGLQMAYGNRKIDYAKLNFSNQFSSGGFNTALPSGEMLGSNLRPYFDVNAGIVYSFNNDITSAYVGASVFHVSSPKQSVWQDTLSRIRRRFTLHGGVNYYIGESQNRMLISGVMMSQSKSFELNIGTAFGVYLGGDDESPKYLYLGGFYRLKDAIYPYLSYQNNGFQFGLTYDIVTSGLKQVSPKGGSIEFSIIYSKPNDSEKRRLMPWNY